MDSTPSQGFLEAEINLFDVPSAPPASNRGAQNTKVDIGLDWLTFTAPEGELTRFMELLGMGEEWVTLASGMWGYPRGIARGNTQIFSGVRGEICVVCKGLTMLELRERNVSDESFLQTVLSVAKNITRLDVAFDTMGSVLHLPRVKRHFETGEVVSRFKGWSEVAPRLFGSDTRKGWTLNVGSRQSASFLRFYDKGLETGTMPANQWTRCELEFKKANAMAAAKLLAESSMLAAAGLLANLIDFKEPGQTDPNKSRHERAGWWADFLAAAERVRLGLPSPKPSLQRAVAWVKKQVGPTLSAIVEALGGDLAVVHEVIADGYARQKPKHRLLAASPLIGAT